MATGDADGDRGNAPAADPGNAGRPAGTESSPARLKQRLSRHLLATVASNRAARLNEDDLRRERVEEEQKTREKAETDDNYSEEPVFPDNSYNNEVLSITLDYLGQLREAKTARK